MDNGELEQISSAENEHKFSLWKFANNRRDKSFKEEYHVQSSNDQVLFNLPWFGYTN